VFASRGANQALNQICDLRVAPGESFFGMGRHDPRFDQLSLESDQPARHFRSAHINAND
jgi:hypothetical protein